MMKPFSRRTFILAAFALIFLAGFGWIVATQGPLAPVKVTVANAAEATLERTLFGIGTVEARRAYAIGPTAAGRVARVLVDQGDLVAADQLLAEMEPVDLDARLSAAAASAAGAAQRVQSAAAALEETRSRAQLAKHSAERYADLRRKSFVSQEAADAKAHEYAAAQAAYESAAAALAAAKDDLKRAQSDFGGAGKSRAHLRLTSPVAGVVSARLAEPGSTVVAGQSVVQVIDPASLWLRVRIDQGRSTSLAVGLAADIVLRSLPSQVLKGRVERIDLVGDAVTEERIANISFEQLPAHLAIGELAEVTLHLPPLDKALAIPAAAVKREGNHTGVWRLVDGRTQYVDVTTGAVSADGKVQVVLGLTPGDAVVVHSTKAISPNLHVKVVDALVKANP